MAGMTPLVKRLLVWIVIIGALLLINYWVHSSGANHSPQAVSGITHNPQAVNIVTLPEARKDRWFTTLSHFTVPIVVLLVYIPLRLYQIKKRTPNPNSQSM